MRRTAQLKWAALAGLLAVRCTTLHRTPSTVLTGDGMLGRAVDESSGCDGPVVEQTHAQQGGSVAARREGEEGEVFGGRVRVLASRLADFKVNGQAPDQPVPADPHLLWSLGAHGGVHGGGVGTEVGLSAVIGESTWVVPWFRLLAGNLEFAWFELDLGSDDPLYFTNIISAGVGMRSEILRLRAGLTSFGRLYQGRDDLEDRKDTLSFAEGIGEDRGDLDGGFYVDLGLQTRLFGVVLGAVVGDSWAGRFGISIPLERSAEE